MHPWPLGQSICGITSRKHFPDFVLMILVADSSELVDQKSHIHITQIALKIFDKLSNFPLKPQARPPSCVFLPTFLSSKLNNLGIHQLFQSKDPNISISSWSNMVRYVIAILHSLYKLPCNLIFVAVINTKTKETWGD